MKNVILCDKIFLKKIHFQSSKTVLSRHIEYVVFRNRHVIKKIEGTFYTASIEKGKLYNPLYNLRNINDRCRFPVAGVSSSRI